MPKVRYLESIADIQAEKSMQNDVDEDHVKKILAYQLCILEYLIKLIDSFRMAIIQDVKFHPMTNLEDFVCIAAKVLPSMRKDKVYAVTIVMQE